MAHDTSLLQDPKERRRVAALRRRPGRRRSSSSRSINAGLKVSGREARALRVVARLLGLGGPGTLLLRAYSLEQVMRMYDDHLVARRAEREETPANAGALTGA